MVRRRGRWEGSMIIQLWGKKEHASEVGIHIFEKLVQT